MSISIYIIGDYIPHIVVNKICHPLIVIFMGSDLDVFSVYNDSTLDITLYILSSFGIIFTTAIGML